MHHVEPNAHVAVTDMLAAVIELGRSAKVTHDDNEAGKSATELPATLAPHATNGLTVLLAGHVFVVVPHDVVITGNDTKPLVGFVLVYLFNKKKFKKTI